MPKFVQKISVLMKKISFFLLTIALFCFSCNNSENDKKNSKDSVKSERKFQPVPNLEIDENNLQTSPTETPMNIVQQLKYESEDGQSISIRYFFDQNGTAMATVNHPSDGELILTQDGDAVSKNMNYKDDKGTKLNVVNESATLTHKGKTTIFTQIK